MKSVYHHNSAISHCIFQKKFRFQCYYYYYFSYIFLFNTGANVVCIATDNKETGVVAVAAENRLLVYLLSSDTKR